MKMINNNYTEEDYEQDLRLAQFTYRKFFKRLSQYREDLIQCAVIYLYENRDKRDLQYTYAGWAIRFSRYAMLRFLRDEKLKTSKGDNVYFCSFDASLNYEDEDFTLLDITPSEDAPQYNFDLKYLYKMIAKCINQKKRTKLLDFDRYKTIILKYVSGLSCAEVARQVGISREAVRQLVDKFVKVYKQALIDDEYLEVGEYGK